MTTSVYRFVIPACKATTYEEFNMSQWIKPQATDLRYGFEITMYISNR